MQVGTLLVGVNGVSVLGKAQVRQYSCRSISSCKAACSQIGPANNHR